METQSRIDPDWLTVFRTQEGNNWLYEELADGRLRQGWGSPGMSLIDVDGNPLDKTEWEAAHRKWKGEKPSSRRFAILRRMLELGCGDIVVMPKMPAWNQFAIARVSGRYRFERACGRDDFGHVVPVVPDSVRTFAYGANDEAYRVSALFSRANHWPAVSFCGSSDHVEAARKLLERPSNLVARPRRELWNAAIDEALRAAAQSLASDVAGWNGQQFEDAVRQCFVDQGYEVKKYRRYDREGGDMDMVVAPPPSRYGLFLPAEIAVQVKWKQGVDEHDVGAVGQIDRWAEWQGSNATKYVISSASGFTKCAREEAEAKDVVLICGLQTMCFLLGMPDRYREEWDHPQS